MLRHFLVVRCMLGGIDCLIDRNLWLHIHFGTIKLSCILQSPEFSGLPSCLFKPHAISDLGLGLPQRPWLPSLRETEKKSVNSIILRHQASETRRLLLYCRGSQIHYWILEHWLMGTLHVSRRQLEKESNINWCTTEQSTWQTSYYCA